jgi:hypothetical protein
MRKHHWLIIGAVILGLLWLQAEADRWLLRREIKRVYLGDVTIQAVDADTKAPLKIVFHGPDTSTDRRWPKGLTTIAPVDVSKITFRWVDVGDVNVGVSAEGYERVPLKLNAATSRELVVIPLRRSGHAD